MKKQENKSRYAILGILTIAPMSGYDLKKFTETSLNYFWNENYAWLYPTLKQLEQEGLTTSDTQKQEGRPERRLYTLTAQGKEELHRWLREPPTFQQIERNEVVFRLFFGDQIPPVVNLEHMQLFRASLEEVLVHLEDLERQAAMADPESVTQGRVYRLMTLSYGLHTVRAQLTWCNETITRLAEFSQQPTEE